MILNVKPVMQPHPVKNPGGDCFACALCAAVNYLRPDQPTPFEKAWNWFVREGNDLVNTWTGMGDALWRAAHELNLEHTCDWGISFQHLDPRRAGHAFPFVDMDGTYAQRLEAYLSAGWVALACIQESGIGPYDEKFYAHTEDHFVVLDGVEQRDGGRSHPHKNTFIHVVCSKNGPYWAEALIFGRKHGAGAWWLVRNCR